MSERNSEGVFIVFEGIDGSGKTTVMDKVYHYLSHRHYDLVKLFEPTNGKWGQKIRDVSFKHRNAITPEKELNLFILDRKENIEKNIKPALREKRIILMDRYYYSTIAYQGALGLDKEHIKKIHDEFIIEPDLVLIFDIKPETGLSRILKNRNGKTTEFEKPEYLKKVRNNYLEFKNKNIYTIDADRSVTIVFQEVIRIINGVLDKHKYSRRQR